MRWPARGRTFGTAIATARATEHTSSPARLWRARRKGSISIVRTSTAEPSGYLECGPREGVNPKTGYRWRIAEHPEHGAACGPPFSSLRRFQTETLPIRASKARHCRKELRRFGGILADPHDTGVNAAEKEASLNEVKARNHWQILLGPWLLARKDYNWSRNSSTRNWRDCWPNRRSRYRQPCFRTC